MKQLYDLFKHVKSHGLVSLPFLGLIQYYLEKNDHSLIKNATTELYENLSHTSLSGARDLRFNDVGELIAKLSFFLKRATLKNIKQREREHLAIAQEINNSRMFTQKTEDPLEDVFEIIDDPNAEHKSMFPYEPPQLQTADEIRTWQQLVDDDFIEL